MGMEDFFLGAAKGVVDAGTQGASIQFQNEQELIRQQSLLDLKNRYAQGERKRQIEALLQLTDDEDEQKRLRATAEAFGPEKAGALMLSQQQQEAERERTAKEAAERLNTATKFFISEFDLPEDEARDRAQLVVDDIASVSDLSPEKMKEIPDLPDDRAENLAPIFNMTSSQLKDYYDSNKGKFPPIPKAGGSTPNFVTMRRKSDGKVVSIPASEVGSLYARTKDGEQVWEELNMVTSTDGKAYQVTPTSITRIDKKEGKDPADLSSRQRKEVRINKTLSTEPFRAYDLDGVRVEELGLDQIDASGGPLNSMAENVGAIFPIGGLGQKENAATIKLRNIRSEIQASMGISSRPLSAILENVFNQIPVPEGISAMAPGSDKKVVAALEQARRDLRTGISTAQEILSGDEGNKEVKESMIRMETALGSINTLLIDRELMGMEVPTKNGRSESLTTFDSLGELYSNVNVRSLIESEDSPLNNKQRRMLQLWTFKLDLAAQQAE